MSDDNLCEGSGTDAWACCLKCGKQFNEHGLVPVHKTTKLPNTRAMYRAVPGFMLTHADVSAMEPNIMAVIARDEVLKAHLASGDMYSAAAKAWFGLPADMDVKKLKPAARKQSKIIKLARQYGAGVMTVWVQALRQDRTMSLDACRRLCQAHDKTYFRTVTYWSEEMARVLKSGYSEDRLDFRRRYYPRPPDLSEVANWPIQATGAAHMNRAIVAIAKRLRRLSAKYPPRFPVRNWKTLTAEELAIQACSAFLVAQVHDALDVEHLPEQKVEVVGILTEEMETPRQLPEGVYYPKVEIKSGIFWSDV